MSDYMNERWIDQPQPDSPIVEILGDLQGRRLVVARVYGYKPFRVGDQPPLSQSGARKVWEGRRQAAHAKAVADASSRARVMAAGPDLLDKCALMVEYVIGVLGREPRSPSVGADILKDVRASIAKAKGEKVK